jgi:hypothetical protein
MATRHVLPAFAGLLVSLLLATSARAIPYFNTDLGFGFDNSVLQLEPDFVIPLDAVFPTIESITVGPGVDGPLPTSTDVGLLAMDPLQPNPAATIERDITWKIFNNTDVSEFILFLTALDMTPFDYSAEGIVIDVGIDGLDGLRGPDAMIVASYGPYFFAGYHLTLDDFTLEGDDLVATRTFRYMVNVAQDMTGPPALGIAYTSMINVPEPATGLLFAGALLLAAGAGRRQRA